MIATSLGSHDGYSLNYSNIVAKIQDSCSNSSLEAGKAPQAAALKPPGVILVHPTRTSILKRGDSLILNGETAQRRQGRNPPTPTPSMGT